MFYFSEEYIIMFVTLNGVIQVATWIENTTEKKLLETIRRISGGDLSRQLIIGNPNDAETNLNVAALKQRGIVGIYELTDA
jgi:hypothetical protein